MNSFFSRQNCRSIFGNVPHIIQNYRKYAHAETGKPQAQTFANLSPTRTTRRHDEIAPEDFESIEVVINLVLESMWIEDV